MRLGLDYNSFWSEDHPPAVKHTYMTTSMILTLVHQAVAPEDLMLWEYLQAQYSCRYTGQNTATIIDYTESFDILTPLPETLRISHPTLLLHYHRQIRLLPQSLFNEGVWNR